MAVFVCKCAMFVTNSPVAYHCIKVQLYMYISIRWLISIITVLLSTGILTGHQARVTIQDKHLLSDVITSYQHQMQLAE